MQCALSANFVVVKKELHHKNNRLAGRGVLNFSFSGIAEGSFLSCEPKFFDFLV